MKKTFKTFIILILSCIMCISLFAACDDSGKQKDNEDDETKMQNVLETTEDSKGDETTNTTQLIPKDSKTVEEILEKINIENINIATDGDFLGYSYMGNLECVIEGTLPGPQDEVTFFYCADANTAEEIKTYYAMLISSTGEGYYTVKKEDNIVFMGPTEVWEDFIDFVSCNS